MLDAVEKSFAIAWHCEVVSPAMMLAALLGRSVGALLADVAGDADGVEPALFFLAPPQPVTATRTSKDEATTRFTSTPW